MAHRSGEEIVRVRAALRRHEGRIDAMVQTWRDRKAPCCPGCMFGETYREAREKCARTAFWLAVLLRRRAASGDAAEAERLGEEYP